MNRLAAALGPLRTFRHGVHPDDRKARTAPLPIEQMPFVDRYVLPLGQHIGAPSKPIVSGGDRVVRGQRIADAGGFVSTTLHAPVTGRVEEVGHQRLPDGTMGLAIVLVADPWSSQALVPQDRPDWRTLDAKGFVASVQAAGIVGLGGAAFPAHVKYAIPEGQPIRHLVINGCECEPYLTTDHRVMAESPEKVIRGIEILAAHLGVEDVTIGVEANKPDAIAALDAAIPTGLPVRVVPLEVKYPQGAEKMLIDAVYGVRVPAGKLPLHVGIVVNNAGTAAALAEWFDEGRPLVDRVMTVTGAGIPSPANLRVPLGTPVRALIDRCGGLTEQTEAVIMGGPMMGRPLPSLDVPAVKGTSGLLALVRGEAALPEEHPCIRCGRCLEACPLFLNPSRLARLSRAERFEEAAAAHAMDCMECASCSWVCPSGIPIVQRIRVAKAEIRKGAS